VPILQFSGSGKQICFSNSINKFCISKSIFLFSAFCLLRSGKFGSYFAYIEEGAQESDFHVMKGNVDPIRKLWVWRPVAYYSYV
jgi:hypothetical protein